MQLCCAWLEAGAAAHFVAVHENIGGMCSPLLFSLHTIPPWIHCHSARRCSTSGLTRPSATSPSPPTTARTGRRGGRTQRRVCFGVWRGVPALLPVPFAAFVVFSVCFSSMWWFLVTCGLLPVSCGTVTVASYCNHSTPHQPCLPIAECRAGSVHGQGQRALPHRHLPGNAAGNKGGNGWPAGDGGLG